MDVEFTCPKDGAILKHTIGYRETFVEMCELHAAQDGCNYFVVNMNREAERLSFLPRPLAEMKDVTPPSTPTARSAKLTEKQA